MFLQTIQTLHTVKIVLSLNDSTTTGAIMQTRSDSKGLYIIKVSRVSSVLRVGGSANLQFHFYGNVRSESAILTWHPLCLNLAYLSLSPCLNS